MFDPKRVCARIEEASVAEAGLSASAAHDVAFHMTDWISDLEAYVGFCRNPGALTLDEVDTVLLAFLQHAPNHIAAASKLYTGFPVSDIFEVGAVSGGADEKA